MAIPRLSAQSCLVAALDTAAVTVAEAEASGISQEKVAAQLAFAQAHNAVRKMFDERQAPLDDAFATSLRTVTERTQALQATTARIVDINRQLASSPTHAAELKRQRSALQTRSVAEQGLLALARVDLEARTADLKQLQKERDAALGGALLIAMTEAQPRSPLSRTRDWFERSAQCGAGVTAP